MPLLGKKIFAPSKPLKDIQGNETVFTIPLTGEKFRTKSDYEKRCSLYKEKIWTCQCTGHVNLSYEEAFKSEKTAHKSLKDSFSTWFEKPALETVHHATVSLDNLVDQAWLKIQQVLFIGENVVLKVKAANRVIKAVVVAVDDSGVQANPTSNCSSPSSDKENSSTEKKASSSPKKWLPPKLLPYKYNIKLESEDKVIKSVPAADLARSDRPPSKDLLRLFIRANTLRAGSTSVSPWVVNDKMVQKYKLPSKFADFLLSPMKMSEASIKLDDELKRKRKSSHSKERPSKKQKLSKSDKKKNGKSPKKGDSVIEIESDSSDDEVVLSKVIRKSMGNTDDSDSDSDSDAPLVKIKSPKKKSTADSDSEDEPLSKMKSSSPKKKSSSPSKSKKSKSDKKEKKEKKKGDKEKKKKKKSKDKEKGLKQITLFELASKKGSKSPTKAGERKSLPSTINIKPPIHNKLIKAQKLEDQTKYKELVRQAAATLNAVQRNNLPKAIKVDVVAKYEVIKEKNLLAKMTPEQRKEYFLNKRRENKRLLAKKYEDTELKLTPLPSPILVASPDNLPNEVFGDVAMVTEFINCYKGLLMPDDEYPIYSDALMKALCNGAKGFAYLSRVLGILLQTLLQDQLAEGYIELKSQISDIHVNPFTSSELVRLCLRSIDSGQEEDNADEEEEEEVDVAKNIIAELEDKEFYQLNPTDKLAILKGLCQRIMGSYSVQDFMEEKQVQANKLSKQKNLEQREMNDKLKKDKLDKMPKPDEVTTPAAPDTNTTGLLTSSFYGTADKPDSDTGTPAELAEPIEPAAEPENEDDLVSTIKSRRVNAAKTAAEKAKKEEERRILAEKSMAEHKKLKAKENLEKQYKDSIEIARMALRIVPIGTDRNHSRYWMFNHTTPGLYIEKGWVTQDYTYCAQSEVDMSSDDDLPVSKLCTPKKQNGMTSPKSTPSKSPKKNPSQEATTFPHIGQNLWFEYDSTKGLDELITSLHHQGLREGSLKAEIKKRYDQINRAIHRSRRNNLELRDSDGDKEVLDGLRAEISDMELKLRNGGLGGVVDFPVWERKVASSNKVEDFIPLVLDVESNILEKFLKGFMRDKKQVLTSSSTTTTKQEVKQEDSDNEEEDEEEEEESERKIHKHRANWREGVETCTTFSRLHVLLGMLENCIKWEKSAEHAKCKICRKKDNDDRLLLCDECNQAFHMYCLRPALRDVPRGDWFCVACVPKKRPEMVFNSRVSSAQEFDARDNLMVPERPCIKHDDTCAECGGDEDLIQCSECPLSYHTFCHTPEFRYPPRGHWQCMECKGMSKRRRGRKGQKKKTSSDRACVNFGDHSSDEEYTVAFKPKKSVKGTKRTAKKQVVIFEADSPPRISRRAPSELSLCEEILNQLVKHKDSWPFAEAVNKKAVPDYYTIIKHPMDFRTMRNKFLLYSSAQEFIDDLSLVFRNTAQYNKEDSEIYKCMVTMEKLVSQLVTRSLPNHIYSRDVVANGYHDHGYSSKRKRR